MSVVWVWRPLLRWVAEAQTPSQEEVGKDEGAMKLGGLFRLPSIPRFSMAEDVFQDVERMLHPRPYLGFRPFQSPRQFLIHPLRHRSDLAPLGRDMPLPPRASAPISARFLHLDPQRRRRRSRLNQ